MRERSRAGSDDSGLAIEHRGRLSEDSGVVGEDSGGVIEHSDEMSEYLDAVCELFTSVGLDSSTMCRYFDTNREDIARRALV